MTRYIIRRLLQFIPVLLAVTLATFVLVRIIPGGPFDRVGDRSLPPEIVANCPETEKRIIRFVGNGKGATGATLFITCAGE